MRIQIVSLAVAAALSVSAAFRAAEADPAFDAYWVKFKAAVAKNDKQAVASMTKLPYLLDSQKLNKQEFIAKYSLLFPAGTSKCLSTQKPIQDQDTYMAFCGEQIYVFTKVSGKWLFTEIGAND